MKKLKIWISFCIAIACCLFFTRCASQSRGDQELRWWEDNGKLKVLSTTAMIDDLVKKVGGEKIDSIALITGDLDPHSYELVKGDDEKFLRADVIFYNGLGLEHGLSLRQNLEGNPKAVSIGDPLFAEDPNQILFVDGATDPHIWLDISLWKKIVPTITATLCSKDPENAFFYRKKAAALEKDMEEADKRAYALLQAVPPTSRFLVTTHDAFNYFARRYLATREEQESGGWEKRFCAPEGLAPDVQLSLSDIRALLKHVTAYQIQVLFPESNVSQDSLRKIICACKEKNHPVRICRTPLYGDAMGDAPSYLEMIMHNVLIISEQLNYE